MASQETAYSDQEIRRLELLDKSRTKGLSEKEMAELEGLSKSVKTVTQPVKPTEKKKPDMYEGSVWSHGGKMYGPPDEPMRSFKDIGQAVGNAATGLLAYPISNIASHYLQTPKTGPGVTLPPDLAEQIGAEMGNKITIKATTPAAQAGAKSLAQPFAPFSLAIEEIPKAVFPIDEKASPEVQQRARENQAWARTTMGGLMLVLPYLKGLGKGFAEARIKSGKGITPQELGTIIEKTPGIPKDVLKKVELTKQPSTSDLIYKIEKLSNEKGTEYIYPDGTKDFLSRSTDPELSRVYPYRLTHFDKNGRVLGHGDFQGVWEVSREVLGRSKERLGVEIKAINKPSTRLESPPEPTGNPIADAKAQADFVAQQRALEAARPPSPGITPAPPQGVKVGEIPPVKVGEIPPVKVGAIPGINPTPVQVLVEALKKAPVILPQRKALIKEEWAKRFPKAEEKAQALGGEVGLEAMGPEMAGKMPNVALEPLNISPEARAGLMDMIVKDKYINTPERKAAFEALKELLDPNAAIFPNKSRAELLSRIYGRELVDTIRSRKTRAEQISYWTGQIANIPRSVMASFDLSAPLRQGLFLIGRPKEFMAAMGDMFRSWGTNKGYANIMEGISRRPEFNLMKESGLELTGLGARSEEIYMGAGVLDKFGKWAKEKLPRPIGDIANIPVFLMDASQRAYTGFLNRLRADTFVSMVKDARELGAYDITTKEGVVSKSLENNSKLSRDVATYVNAATGRGHLADWVKKGDDVVNALFFSPRLMSSRLHLLNPRTYVGTPKVWREFWWGKGKEPAISPYVRRAAMKDAARLFGFYTTVSALAKASGQEIGADPRSPDFTKTLSGNTRLDIGGGFGTYGRTAFLIASPLLEQLGIIDSAGVVSSTTGKVKKIGGGYNEISPKEIIIRFLESKENPVLSFATTVANMRGADGKPIKWAKEVSDRIIPMLAADMIDVAKDDPEALKMVILGTLATFGAGLQTYPPAAPDTFIDKSEKEVLALLEKYKINPSIGQKNIKGEPIPPEDIATILHEGGPEMTRRVNLIRNMPNFNSLPEETKKKLLSNAVAGARKLAKTKYKMEKK